MCTTVDCRLVEMPDGTVWIGVVKGDLCPHGTFAAPYSVESKSSEMLNFEDYG